MKLLPISFFMFICLFSNSQSVYNKESIKSVIDRANLYQLENPWTEFDDNWICGTYYAGVMACYQATGGKALLEQCNSPGEKHNWQIPALPPEHMASGVNLANAVDTAGSKTLKKFKYNEIIGLADQAFNYALENPYTETDRNWIRATLYSGVMELYYATKNESYRKKALNWGEKHGWEVGTESSGMNRLFCSMTWAELCLLDSDLKKIEPTLKWLGTNAPNSPGGAEIWFGHGPAPYDQPLYSDALYGAPVFPLLYQATGDKAHLDMLGHVFWTVTDALLDKDEMLYYRDPGYIGQKSPNDKKILWSRGNGWVFASIPRILRNLPEDFAGRERYVELFHNMALSLAERQQNDGFWRSNLDDPFHYIMPESSGTAFFVAGFAWGIREGLLDASTYLPVVIRGWNALASSVHPSGKMGWVQPVDAQPRPSNPETTHEYATGLFLSAAGQVALLARDGAFTADKIMSVLPETNGFLSPSAFKKGVLSEKDHPLGIHINTFLSIKADSKFRATGQKKNEYLKIIAVQVHAMQKYQDNAGRIIDPVEKEEMYFTTPCYAHSVAVLAKAGYPISKETQESGMKALDAALAAKVAGEAPGNHGDFFTWPMVFAFELFEGVASPERLKTWKQQLEKIDRRNYRAYREPVDPSEHQAFYNAFSSPFANNWNLVNVAGEFARYQNTGGDLWYVDYCLTMQTANFTPLGMYNEHGNPLAYDAFSRHYLSGMLQRGYRSFGFSTYRDLMWRGAWTSLFMQSPFGELPTGFRSSHHIWNEAEQCVIFEIYASEYARMGYEKEAGIFKRAAMISLESVKNWIREDGSGFIVKNRYPIEARHGYEDYSVHTCYNMLACSMLAQAWQFSDDSVAEQPSPADVGGFVVPVLNPFHKIFASVDGTYLEYDTSGDQMYNPTGIIRVHILGSHPQLGPSDGCAEKFSGEGIALATGPSWQNSDGSWSSLAGLKPDNPIVEILKETNELVQFKVIFTIKDKNNKELKVSENIKVKKGQITVESEITGEIKNMRVTWPMLTFNGETHTNIELADNTATLVLEGKKIKFQLVEPDNFSLTRSGKEYKHSNGIVEPLVAEFKGNKANYTISLAE